MDDGYVIYHAVEDMAHYLNPTAAVVFELCDGEHTPSRSSPLISRRPLDLPIRRARKCWTASLSFASNG